MKKICLFAAAGLLAAVSCSTRIQAIAVPESEEMTLTAIQEGGSETRTVLAEDLVRVLWTPGDAINLFYQDKSARFESINQYENTDVAQFKGELLINVVTGGNEDSGLESSYFYGLYPYSDEARFYEEKGYIETTLPYEQVAAENTFADDLFITMGRSTSWSMPFYNVCSGMRFTVDQEGVTSVTLRSKDGRYPLAGRFVAGFDPETERPAVMEFIDPGFEIRVIPPEGDCFRTGVYYYIVTLPGTHESGITIELEGLPYQASVTTSSPVTFKRSRFLSTDLTADRYYADILPLESIDLDIENEGVRGFLEDLYIDETYGTDTDYTYSGVSEYTGKGSDKPNPVRFNWKTTGSRTLTVWDPVSGTTVFEGDASGSTTEIYNLIPGRKYNYSVDGEISWKSSFTPVGPLRMIYADTGNFRDLGGWTGEGGKTIAYGKLYRGRQISSSDLELFQSLGIGVDLDLRGNPDGSPGAVFDPSLITWTNIQVYQFMYKTDSSSGGGGSSGGGPGGSSSSGTSGYTAELYRQALSYVISCLDEGKAVYFHCIGGADRTGTLAFLIEALLGVSEVDMSKDYELTSFYSNTPRKRNDDNTRPFRQLVFYLKTFEGETLQEKVTKWAMTGTNALTLDEIDRLKQLMLE